MLSYDVNLLGSHIGAVDITHSFLGVWGHALPENSWILDLLEVIMQEAFSDDIEALFSSAGNYLNKA